MGGLTEYFNIIPMAQVKNIQCCPHIWGSSIAVRAGLHAAFAQPNFPNCLFPEELWFELDRTANVFREELSNNKLVIENGYVLKPEEPGLGLDINEKIINEYRIG